MAERRISSTTRNPFILLTLLTQCFHLALAGVIKLPYQNLTVSNTNFCTDDKDWIAYPTYQQDCIGAIQHFYNLEVAPRRWPKTDYEFLTPKARPQVEIEPMRTPRKYTVGTCTLAVVMLTFFGDKDLPGNIEGPHASRDVTSFWEIWEAARMIENVCLLYSSKPGWATEGGREAIGVFLWGTNSIENKRVPQGEPIEPWDPTKPGLALLSNGSTTSLAFSR